LSSVCRPPSSWRWRLFFALADGFSHRHHLGVRQNSLVDQFSMGACLPGHLDALFLAGHHPDPALFGASALAAGAGPHRLWHGLEDR
jgi:hypothetical protein